MTARMPVAPPGAESIAAIGSIGDQTEQRRRRPGFYQGYQVPGGRGADRPSGAGPKGGPVDPISYGLSCRNNPGYGRARDPTLCLGRAGGTHKRAHNRAVQPHGGQIRVALHGWYPARPQYPGCARRPTKMINRVPFPVRGQPHWRQGAPAQAIQIPASLKRRLRPAWPTYVPAHACI